MPPTEYTIISPVNAESQSKKQAMLNTRNVLANVTHLCLIIACVHVGGGNRHL